MTTALSLIHPNKSQFGANSVEFLGHLITTEGICPLVEKDAAIQGYPRPETTTQLRRFLGMINFYRRFLPNAVNSLQPLHNLLHGAKKKNSPLVWTDEADSAFQQALTLLSEVCCVTPNQMHQLLSLQTPR